MFLYPKAHISICGCLHYIHFMKVGNEHPPVLYFSINEEDREACNVIMKARVVCRFVGTMNPTIPTPVLHYRYRDYQGVEEIKEFVKRWKR